MRKCRKPDSIDAPCETTCKRYNKVRVKNCAIQADGFFKDTDTKCFAQVNITGNNCSLNCKEENNISALKDKETTKKEKKAIVNAIKLCLRACKQDQKFNRVRCKNLKKLSKLSDKP